MKLSGDLELSEMAIAVARMVKRGPRPLDEPIKSDVLVTTETVDGITVRAIQGYDVIQGRMMYRFDYRNEI